MDTFSRYVSAYLDISLDDNQLEKFRQYEEILLNRNREFNLTAIREPADIRTKHFLDSLTCWLVMQDSSPQKVIDIGSGAGFPGIPLKIVFPMLDIALVESTGKKVRFCNEVIQLLGLSGIHAIQARAEELAHQPEHRAQYDWAIARAVAPMPALVEYLLPFVNQGGRMLAQKGASAKQETDEAMDAITILGGELIEVRKIDLPEGITDHHLVCIQKVSDTPLLYPRSGGLPIKKPLLKK